MRKLLHLLTAPPLLLLALAPSQGAAAGPTYSFPAERDAYLKSDKLDENRGTAPELSVKNGSASNWVAVYGFNPTIPAGEIVTSAVLRLWVRRSDTSTIAVHRVTDTWTELEVTYRNTGEDFDPVAEGSFTPSVAETYVEIDVTPLVTGWVNGSIANHGLVVRAPSGGDTRFTAREYKVLEERPQLVITTLAAPDLMVVKSSTILNDPVNGSSNAKAIPSAEVAYSINVSNSAAGSPDSDSVTVTDPMPPGLKLFIGDLGTAGSGPVAFTDGSPASGLTYSYSGLSSSTDSLFFSSDGGTSFTYTPAADAEGYDPAITHLRIVLDGILAGSTGAGDPSFKLGFKLKVK